MVFRYGPLLFVREYRIKVFEFGYFSTLLYFLGYYLNDDVHTFKQQQRGYKTTL